MFVKNNGSELKIILHSLAMLSYSPLHSPAHGMKVEENIMVVSLLCVEVFAVCLAGMLCFRASVTDINLKLELFVHTVYTCHYTSTLLKFLCLLCLRVHKVQVHKK